MSSSASSAQSLDKPVPEGNKRDQIRPNAVTQLVAPLQARVGGDRCKRLFQEAGFSHLPDASHMLDEKPVARLHGLLRQSLPEADARDVATEAGRATAEYLLKHRIPGPAAMLLNRLPASWAMRLLVRAIARHAWTFAGSGQFFVACRSPWVLGIRSNPLACEQRWDTPVCIWHASVFERLFREIVNPVWRVREISCCAQGHDACLFLAAAHPERHLHLSNTLSLQS